MQPMKRQDFIDNITTIPSDGINLFASLFHSNILNDGEESVMHISSDLGDFKIKGTNHEKMIDKINKFNESLTFVIKKYHDLLNEYGASYEHYTDDYGHESEWYAIKSD